MKTIFLKDLHATIIAYEYKMTATPYKKNSKTVLKRLNYAKSAYISILHYRHDHVVFRFLRFQKFLLGRRGMRIRT